MPKITFMGAGSTVFAKAVLGDSMLAEALRESNWRCTTSTPSGSRSPS
jgi:alpha-galactosidase/6-phospho-beta-glucosidase family protein